MLINKIIVFYRLVRFKCLISMLLLVLWSSLSFGAGDTLSVSIVIRDVVAIDEVFIPSQFALHPPYPNPFNPDVNLMVDIAEPAQTKISIYNIRGHEVVVLESRLLQPGRYVYQWQATGHPSGIYFARIQSALFDRNEKINLLK